MRRGLVLFLGVFILFLVFPLKAKSSDNIYGDYLISGSKKRISMDLEGASLVDVLKVLSQQTGLNFVSSEAVKDRKLTLYLEKVPLKEAMDVIFKANNLTYEFYPESNIFIVKEMGKPTIELKTKVYQLKYVQLKTSRMYREIDSAMKREEEIEESETTSETSEEEEGILEAVKKVLSEYGRATEEPLTNSLIITDVPSQFPIIDKLIESLDVPAPQVLIEVEILDVDKSLVDRIGIKFEKGLYASFSGGSRTTSFPFLFNSTPSIRENIGYATSSEEALFPKSAVKLGILDFANFKTLLEFYSKDQSTKYLARPKILTLSGQTAEIKLSTEEAVSVQRTEDPDTGEITYEIERAETGTILRVTPQVNPQTREITMLIEPKTATAEESGYSLEGFIVKDVHNRQTKSVVRLKESQTLMIGGLLRNEEVTIKYKVPLLGDIPLLGALFRHKSKDSTERELLVFLTPHIVSDSESFKSTKSLFRESREQTNSWRLSAIEEALAKFE
ncbi:MAG TPA: hypothetical protein ENI31_03415 [Candidatus Omnitrophica bacterium]|nr:MAG: hypothetical protein DRP61_00125 [Candidatus Omnitrophota bacterium]RKY35392.1 MAG: hypothetical protein DRP69_01565 [Candidatus Omnitrophota bacterium]RKY44879.1 MAG: hypothetical protein DRP80_00790 [Candidatus Omnitrophota bacterium]HEC69319.1 hypothetical protein [Candidatus Omnitrophota bacterium]